MLFVLYIPDVAWFSGYACGVCGNGFGILVYFYDRPIVLTALLGRLHLGSLPNVQEMGQDQSWRGGGYNSKSKPKFHILNGHR
jgi:hypothetical protein